MPRLHDELIAAYIPVRRRGIPARWTEQEPVLGQFPNTAAIITTIRTDDDPELADAALRALVHLGHADADAFVTALVALLPLLPERCGPNPSYEFLEDVLRDLIFVLLDAPDVDNIDRLPRRLTKRAYRRARRRYETEKRYKARTWSGGLNVVDGIADPLEMEQLVADREHIDAIRRHMDDAIFQGRVPGGAWRLFRQGRLAPAIGAAKATNATRSQIYRASLAVKREVRRAEVIKRELSHT